MSMKQRSSKKMKDVVPSNTDEMKSLRDEIVEFFADIRPEAYHIEDAAYVLGIKGADELAEFMSTVADLSREGILSTKDDEYYFYKDAAQADAEGGHEISKHESKYGTEKNRFTSLSKMKDKTKAAHKEEKKKRQLGDTAANTWYQGIYKGQRQGRGLFVGEDGVTEIIIQPEHRHGALHNDEVKVEILGNTYPGGRPEGVVRDVVTRANTFIVGTYDRQKSFGFVIPDDERIVDDVYVELSATMDARSGAKVLVEVTEWPTSRGRHPEGRIVQILGYKGDVGLDINCIMAEHKIPFAFPDNVLQEADSINLAIDVEAGRLDLRAVPMVTIDGEDAKDLDDAVSCELLGNGNFMLGVHIADVSHYVRGGSLLDKEAYKRGTSVYLVDRVVPMLPPVLSNGICSLNAHEDRYAMSCIMEINSQGRVIKSTITPSVIRVDRRCSYNEVYKALSEQIIPEDLTELMPLVHNLHDVANALIRMREKSGALNFEFPEYKVLLNEEGTPLRIVRKDRTIADKIIEACMLIANETVATYLSNTDKPSIYRIHERPSEEKLNALQTVVTYLGKSFHFDADTIEPRDIQSFLDSIQGTEVEQIAQIMTLRSMQQARYSPVNAGHFGLASKCYTHFTSPIRRYPDLIVHRLLKKALHWRNGYTQYDDTEAYLSKAAEHCSIQEQVAVAAERDTLDLKKVQYMEPFVGEVFEGRISSITSFGMFVELENGIDGLVHIATLTDDYYFFDEEHFLLVGRQSGKEYHLGQEVTVTLVKADSAKKQIDFVLGAVEDISYFLNRINRRMGKPIGYGSNALANGGSLGRSRGALESNTSRKSGRSSRLAPVFSREKANGTSKKKDKKRKDSTKKSKVKGKKKDKGKRKAKR